jgi:rhodanese-related sulfurtransferase
MSQSKNIFLKTIVSFAFLAVCIMPVSNFAQDDALLKALDTYLSNIHVKKYNVIKVDELNNQRKVRPNLIIVDVRKDEEIKEMGMIPGAINIRLNTLAKNLEKLPKKDAAIIVYCKSGIRAAYATMSLGLLGYTNVKAVDGGFEAWTKAGFEVKK